MRQLGEKKIIMNYVVLCYPSGFQADGGMMCVIFFFSGEKWKLSVKERTVPCFGKAQEQQRQRTLPLVQGSALLKESAQMELCISIQVST